jgi:vacuolar-type H+-ATPase subunit I/STV1
MLIKIGVAVLCGFISLPLFAASDCTQLKGCEKKFCEIEQQLVYAREHNNKKQVAGLTKSLENSKQNCTNKSLKDDLLKKIADAKSDLADYEDDLAKAEKSGKSQKVAKYKSKIAEEQAEINRLEKELAELP